MNLPEKYLSSMKELIGDKELKEYLDSFRKPRLYGLRVNTSKISTEDFLKISPFKLKPVPWIPNGFYYDEDDKPAKHPYYFAGLYYLQEPSAMTPANVLPVNKGDRVLDLCAAPGGKSTELGARLNKTGLLVSNDVSASRAKALLKNIEVFGIGNIILTCEYPDKLATVFGSFFDKILVDAPCSGEGMFRKDSKLIRSWENQGPEYFAPLQRQILDSAYDMLKDGGQMVYSTCTFSRMEDEDNIEWFLNRHPDMSLQRIYDYEGFTRAYGMEEAVRLFPYKLEGEGHFTALMKKDGVLLPDVFPGSERAPKLPDELSEFLDGLGTDIDRSLIRINGDKVSLIPAGAKEIKGLRTLRCGLLLGEMKKNRFEPSQALAMTLNPESYNTVLNLAADDTNTVKYLKGETIDADAARLRGNGKNVLVCVDGFPLGWGRLNGLTIKNKYLPGWRWM